MSESIRQGNRTILIQGAQGIGKTTLAEHFITEAARDRSVLALRSRCSPFENIPFNAVDEIIDELVEFLEYSGPRFVDNIAHHNIGSLLRVFPLFKNVFHSQQEKTSEHGREKTKLKAAGASIAAILNNIAKARPIVLFMDDFQWSDNDSIYFIAELLQHIESRGIMLLLGITDQETAPYQLLHELIPRSILRKEAVKTMKLIPFDENE